MKYYTFAVSCLLTAVLLLDGCALFKKSLDPVPQPAMVYVEGGTFLMGDVLGDGNTDAQPVHEVTLEDFQIGKYEVTYQQFDAFAGRADITRPPDDSLGRGQRAVVYVNWDQARAFCNYFGWRLPTEQEWEYAARSGGMPIRFAGVNNPDSLKAYARTRSNSVHHSFAVGSKRPNALGLHDMSGNVLEWIGDYYQYYPDSGELPSWDDLDKREVRILRGGSFKESKHVAATYRRIGMLADAQGYDMGFRCAADVK